ncbi:ribosome maturation factor RimM [Fusobacterium gonidiaformans]|uniref:ribosome maturation factor RimM n=1 Tax=Fusobacterium gonidiaformans TaxID=849 RepID=UPI0001BC6534|nr:ribosome maturation factor RimM [Fusobacterium gonidiaformans]AVQ16631.1 16S rRNA processing protein RimM [Fusobacterium gonidiaformans ATCC 25563]EFS28204.1 16S rRNA processing protein RimM [Fusobacterium gonidiaformans ATCC 25563]
MKLLTAGRILGTHHLLGAVKVVSSLEELPKLLGSKCMTKLETGENILLTPTKIEHLVGDSWVFQFEEIKNKAEALKLRNALIEVRRDLLGYTEEDIFLSDYIGLLAKEVETKEEIGRVEEIFETAAHPILVIQSEHYETMVPDTPTFVKEVNFETGEIYIELLEGMKEEKRK